MDYFREMFTYRKPTKGAQPLRQQQPAPLPKQERSGGGQKVRRTSLRKRRSRQHAMSPNPSRLSEIERLVDEPRKDQEPDKRMVKVSTEGMNDVKKPEPPDCTKKMESPDSTMKKPVPSDEMKSPDGIKKSPEKKRSDEIKKEPAKPRRGGKKPSAEEEDQTNFETIAAPSRPADVGRGKKKSAAELMADTVQSRMDALPVATPPQDSPPSSEHLHDAHA